MKKSAVSLFPLFRRAIAVLSLFFLLSNPPLAVEGAKNGLLLWGMVVLPTLFPFMLCSAAVVGLGGVPWLTRPLRPFFSRFLGLTENGSYVLLSGFLCGYPMGAKTCSEFYRDGRISRSEARRLLAISNHPSPMFLLGYVMSQIAGLSQAIPSWKVLLSLYLPVVPLAFLSFAVYPKESEPLPLSGSAPVRTFSLDVSIMSCAETMVKIGGYIIIFSIAALYAAKIPFSRPVYRSALLGAIEITTGIQIIADSVPGFTGALLIVMAAAFGGLSGVFQTKSVLFCKEADNAKENPALQDSPCFSICHYVLWKLLHGLLSGACFILAGFVHPAG